MQIKYSSIGTEPVSLAEAKSWLKADYDDEDILISTLISGIRGLAEEVTGLSLVAKTIEYFEEDIEIISDWVKLPYPEHDAITEVKVNGEVTTDYYTTGLTQKLIKANGISSTDENDLGLYVKYTTLGSVPTGFKLAFLKELAEVYEKRSSSSEVSLTTTTSNFHNYLLQLKVY